MRAWRKTRAARADIYSERSDMTSHYQMPLGTCSFDSGVVTKDTRTRRYILASMVSTLAMQRRFRFTHRTQQRAGERRTYRLTQSRLFTPYQNHLQCRQWRLMRLCGERPLRCLSFVLHFLPRWSETLPCLNSKNPDNTSTLSSLLYSSAINALG